MRIQIRPRRQTRQHPCGPCSNSLSCPNYPDFPLSICPKCSVRSDSEPRTTVSWHDRQFGPCPFPRAATLAFCPVFDSIGKWKKRKEKINKERKKIKEKEERELIFGKIIFFLSSSFNYFFSLHKIYNSTSLKLIWLFLFWSPSRGLSESLGAEISKLRWDCEYHCPWMMEEISVWAHSSWSDFGLLKGFSWNSSLFMRSGNLPLNWVSTGSPPLFCPKWNVVNLSDLSVGFTCAVSRRS